MKNLLQKFILLCLLSLSWHTANATYLIDGIVYNLLGTDASVEAYIKVQYYTNKNIYTGSITIPSTVT